MTHIQRNLLLALSMGFIITVVLIKTSTIGGHWYLWWPLLSLLSYPFRFPNNPDIFSIWGGSGPTNVYSLLGVYQDAGINAYSVFGILVYQRATGDAFQFCGITLCQKAGAEVGQIAGIALYQRSEHDAGQALGIIGIQDAGEESHQFFGVSLFRRSRERNNPVFGLLYINFAFLIRPFLKRKRFA